MFPLSFLDVGSREARERNTFLGARRTSKREASDLPVSAVSIVVVCIDEMTGVVRERTIGSKRKMPATI
jgi:hypothetical protein